MGKASRIKSDLDDITELVEIIQVLKDVADTKFHSLAGRKDRFFRFGESFIEFFRMISLSKVVHPLIRNDNPIVGIVVITSEAGFMGELNAKVVRGALAERDKYEKSVLFCLGKKGGDKLKTALGEAGKDVKVFEDINEIGLYQISINVKDYLVKAIMDNRIGRVLVVYPWSKTFMLQKTRVIRLLPCDELIAKQRDFVDSIESVLEESDPKDIIGILADMWVMCRIYEMLHDTQISEAAAQSQQLESSIQRMRKDKKGAQMSFRKAKKGDIDKSMREVFTAKMMTRR